MYSNLLSLWIVWVLPLLLMAGCGQATTPQWTTVSAQRADLVFASSFYGEIEARVSHPIFAPELRHTWQITVESVLPEGSVVKQGDVVLRFVKDTMEEDLRDQQRELAVAKASYRKVAEQHQDERMTRTLALRRNAMGVELAKLALVEGVHFISKIDLKKAKVELARAELLLDVSKKELVTFDKKAAAALAVEHLKVTTAEEKVKEIQEQLAVLEVKAPADGVLYAPYTRLNWLMSKVAPGKVVRPGDKILEVPELDHFNAAIYVRQRDAALLRVGDEASVIATMFPEEPLLGKVVRKDDVATTHNERTGTTAAQGMLKEFKVMLELVGGSGKIRPGGTVRADIRTVLAKSALVAPLAALKESRGAHWVVLANGDKQQVAVGKISTTHAEIFEGLAEGQAIRLD